MKRRRPTLLTVCNAIGGAILFSSFIAQNYFMSEWSQQRERLTLSQLAVELQQLRFEHWQNARLAAVQQSIEPTGQRRIEPNAPLLELATFKSIQALVNLDRLTSVRAAVDGDEARRARQLHADDLSKASSLFGRNSLDSLNELTEMANRLEESIQARAELQHPNARFEALYSAVLDEEGWWNTFFLWAYIAGSTVLAAAYLLSRHGRYAER